MVTCLSTSLTGLCLAFAALHSYGHVWLCRDRERDCLVAIKKFKDANKDSQVRARVHTSARHSLRSCSRPVGRVSVGVIARSHCERQQTRPWAALSARVYSASAGYAVAPCTNERTGEAHGPQYPHTIRQTSIMHSKPALARTYTSSIAGNVDRAPATAP